MQLSGFTEEIDLGDGLTLMLTEEQLEAAFKCHVDIAPYPAPRPRARVMGKHATVYTEPKYKKAKKMLADDLRQIFDAKEVEPYSCGLIVVMNHYLPRGKTVKRERPTTKPDIDNLDKTVMDAATDAGIWKDDSLVVKIACTKLYEDDESPVGLDFLVTPLPNVSFDL